MEAWQQIEASIQQKFRKTIWNRFIMGIKEYQMINQGDVIAVCISGGKDSMLLAKCIQHLQRYSPIKFKAKYLVMNPGYLPENLQKIKDNAKLMNIPITIFNTQIFDTVFKTEKSPCYLCARMRRGFLYKFAKELGCNKIALGHHFDDVIETILLGMIYGGQVQTMMPKLHSTNFKGMELIRPLYMVKERDIIHWAAYNNLSFIQCACRFTELEEQEKLESHGLTSKRAEMKRLISSFRKINPNIEMNIFRSVCNVNLSTIISYQKDGEEYSFLDNYDSKY